MRKCWLCQIPIHYNAKSCAAHGSYSPDKKCGDCGKHLTKNNKSGYCLQHAFCGDRNPMAGRSVYSTWVAKYGTEEADRRKDQALVNNTKASKKLWQDPAYRALIKETTTGKKRSVEFKAKQSRNAKRQFEDPAQRELRSEAIHQSYINGTHNPDNMGSNQYGNRGFNEDGIFFASSVERKRMEVLKASGVRWKRYEVNDFDFRILYEWEGKTHLYLPDFVIYRGDGSILIEEMKSNLKHISEQEWEKARAAEPYLAKMGIQYRIIDETHHAV